MATSTHEGFPMFQGLTLSLSSGCVGGLVEPQLMTVITVRQICGITRYINIKLYIILKQTIPLNHVFFCDVTQCMSLVM